MEFCEGGQVNDPDYMEDRGINVHEVRRHVHVQQTRLDLIHSADCVVAR